MSVSKGTQRPPDPVAMSQRGRAVANPLPTVALPQASEHGHGARKGVHHAAREEQHRTRNARETLQRLAKYTVNHSRDAVVLILLVLGDHVPDLVRFGNAGEDFSLVEGLKVKNGRKNVKSAPYRPI